MGMIDKKRIVFEEEEKRHVDLKLKLKMYGLTQTNFFRCCISGIVNDDPDFLNYFSKVLEEYSYHKSKQKRAQSEKLVKKGLKKLGDFGFADQEIDDIFDLIEKEHPDL